MPQNPNQVTLEITITAPGVAHLSAEDKADILAAVVGAVPSLMPGDAFNVSTENVDGVIQEG